MTRNVTNCVYLNFIFKYYGQTMHAPHYITELTV